MGVKRVLVSILITAMIGIFLFGCGAGPEKQMEPQETPRAVPPTESVAPEEVPQPSESPFQQPEEEGPVSVRGKEEIRSALETAIEGLHKRVELNVAEAELSDRPDLDVTNIYYEIQRDKPRLKYAYDIAVTWEADTLLCELSYMPYQTGEFPDGFSGISVSSLDELIHVADTHLGEDPVSIKITNRALEPDMMNRALQQCGGGYILCALNRDGTQIEYSPAAGLSMSECLDGLEQAGQLADQIIGDLLEDTMTERERAEVLFSFVTETVHYDPRYESDLEHMPYASRTALGALKDGTAICGGYSNAVKLLFEKAGVRCYNVSGSYQGQEHMWNIALLDGDWLWFDATAGRGSSLKYGLRHFAQEELDPLQYQWKEQAVSELCAD